MNSELLDIAIGVVFTWFLYSLVLSGLNEAFTWVTRARAKHLWLGISRLLDPTTTDLPRTFLDLAWRMPFGHSTFDQRPLTTTPTASPEASANVVGPARVTERNWRKAAGPQAETPKVQGLYDALGSQIVEVAKPRRLTKTTHIAKDAFANAVLSVASNVTAQDLVATARQIGWTDEQLDPLEATVDGLPEDTASQPVSRATVEEWASPTLPLDQLISLYAAAANRLSVRDVVRYVEGNEALAEAVAQAATAVTESEQLEAVRTTIETWFDREMARVSATYRRQSRKILAVLALVLVLTTHANAVGMFQELRHDDKLRQTLANGALTSSAAANIEEALALGVCSPADEATATTTDPLRSAALQLDCTADLVDGLDQYRIGLALSDLRAAHERSTDDDGQPTFRLNDVGPYLTDVLAADHGVLGRAMTLVALALGAQFWFDVLRRLVGIRKVLTQSGGAAG